MRRRIGRQPPQFLTWAAILGYVLVASGLPLPVGAGSRPVAESPAAKRLAGKDRSRPFPCMDKPCGCATAEQCFTSCCCHTPAQTLAWARAHEVAPAVLAALERRVAVGRRPARAEKSCCGRETPAAEASCCARETPAAEATCCSSARPATAPDDTAATPEPRSRVVTLRAMLACGGIVAEWFAAGAALPPPRVELALAVRLPDTCTVTDDTCDSPASSPAAPPPRAA